MGPPRALGDVEVGHLRPLLGTSGHPTRSPPAIASILPGATTTLSSSWCQNLFCFKLDAVSVPEALATTIRILLMLSIV